MNPAKFISATARRQQETLYSAAKKEKTLTLEFFISFVSFFLLIYSNTAGTWAIVGFLLPWALIVVRKLFLLPQALVKNWPLLLLPALTVFSTAWSIEPSWTLRASLEFSATVLVAILAGTYVKPRILIAALLSALVLIAILCMIRHNALVTASEDLPVAGIFGSKNAFSGAMAMMMLTAIPVFLDPRQLPLFRLMALAGISLTPLLLIMGQSLDAIISVIFAVSVFLSVRMLWRFQPKTRLILSSFMFVVVLIAYMFFSFSEIKMADILHALGKDPTLTGRTDLWNYAFKLIAEKPIQGVGYNAFWRIGNPDARYLWYISHVPMGSGFNFHNEYIQMLVELGFLGLTIFIYYLASISRGIIRGILSNMNSAQLYAFLMFIFFLIRTPVEASLFGQFNITLIIFCLCWMYFRQSSKPAPQPYSLPKKGRTSHGLPDTTHIRAR